MKLFTKALLCRDHASVCCTFPRAADFQFCPTENRSFGSFGKKLFFMFYCFQPLTAKIVVTPVSI